MTEHLRFQIIVPIEVKYDDEAEVFVAGSPALDVYSQDETREEAIESARDALELYFKHCYQRGILVKILRERGFAPVTESPALPRPAPTREAWPIDHDALCTELSVPLYLMQQPLTSHPGDGRCPS